MWSPYQVSSGGQRLALDRRRGPGHRRGAGRAGERDHGGLEVHRGDALDVAGARAEAGAPQQALGLAVAELALVDGDRGDDRVQRARGAGRRRDRRDGAGRAAGRGLRRGRDASRPAAGPASSSSSCTVALASSCDRASPPRPRTRAPSRGPSCASCGAWASPARRRSASCASCACAWQRAWRGGSRSWSRQHTRRPEPDLPSSATCPTRLRSAPTPSSRRAASRSARPCGSSGCGCGCAGGCGRAAACASGAACACASPRRSAHARRPLPAVGGLPDRGRDRRDRPARAPRRALDGRRRRRRGRRRRRLGGGGRRRARGRARPGRRARRRGARRRGRPPGRWWPPTPWSRRRR